MNRRELVAALVVAVGGSLVAGCAREDSQSATNGSADQMRAVTLQQCKSVTVGMTREQVYELLGPPHEYPDEGAEMWYEDPTGSSDDLTGVLIIFENDSVARTPAFAGKWQGQ
jgi:hypothetical protein